jgi:diguanylate cyclase (GGDEF)-like protein
MDKKPLKTVGDFEEEVSQLNEKIKKLESRLSMSNSAFLNIVGKSLDGIVILDKERMVVYTNYAAISLFDRNIADLLGEPLDLVLRANVSSEINIPHSDRSVSIAEVSMIETEWNNEPSYLVSFRDITERKKSEAVLTYMSQHDYLTDLPNRVYFEKKMSSAIRDAEENKEHMALLYLDLDNFKMVNDTLGHDIGDLLLKEVSHMLKASIRQKDTVARLGGDEFALILRSLRKPDYAATIAKSILEKLSDPLDLDGKKIFTNASIGIAVYPFGGKTATDLIKNADTAMYKAKNNGRSQYCFFSKELSELNKENLQIATGIRSALENNELSLNYQPIIDLKTSACFGFEALLRWNHPELGLVPPNKFLPAAEDLGLMKSIGDWVVKQALKDYYGLKQDNLFISINLSVDELDGAKVADTILKSIKSLKINPQNIIFELTETSVMSKPEDSIEKLQQLSKLGVQVAIDDYGTGYSSLSYIKRLPVSLLKVDKSFVDDITPDSNDTIIVKSTIQLAHGLGLKVIAEGVESKEQFEFLQKHGCDYIQGFYYAKPMNLKALTAFIKKG